MGAVPPKFPPGENTVYTPELPTFAQLAGAELGDAGTPDDGFDSIFNPVANEFPGGSAIISELDQLSSDFQSSADATAAPLDNSFLGDVARASIDGENLIGDLGTIGIDIQAQVLPDFPALSDIPIGALAPGFLQVDTGVAERSIAGTTVGVRADGLVAWYIDGRESEPINVYISVDGGGWALMGTSRGGNQMLGFDTTGHFIAIEWRDPRGVLAQAYIDNRGADGATEVIQPPAGDGTNTGGEPGTPTQPGPVSIPPVPEGLAPSGILSVSKDGLINWSTTNVTEARVTVSMDGGPEKLFAIGNSGSNTVTFMVQGHTYRWLLRDTSHGVVGTILAEVAVNEIPVAAPAPPVQGPPAVITKWSTPGGLVTGTAEDAKRTITLPAGYTWRAVTSNTSAGQITEYVPFDADGKDVVGLFGSITPVF